MLMTVPVIAVIIQWHKNSETKTLRGIHAAG